MDIKSLLKDKKFTKEEKRIDHSFQALGIEVQEYFNDKKLWWIFWKFPEQDIFEALKACKSKGITNKRYLLGILYKKTTD